MPVRDEALQASSSKHPIPQNVMDVEFKVVGDITVRQFMALIVGGLLCFLFFRIDLPTFWKYVLAGISAITTLAIAFVPLQERTLDVWITNFIKSLVAPSQRLWIKELNPPAYFIADYAAIIKNEIITLSPTKSRNKLEEYLSINTPDQPIELDQNEGNRLTQINQFMKSRKPSVQVDLSSTSNRPITPYIDPGAQQNLADIVLSHNKSVDRALLSANMASVSNAQINIPIGQMTNTFVEEDRIASQPQIQQESIVPNKSVDNMMRNLQNTVTQARGQLNDNVLPTQIDNVNLGQQAIFDVSEENKAQKDFANSYHKQIDNPQPVASEPLPVASIRNIDSPLLNTNISYLDENDKKVDLDSVTEDFLKGTVANMQQNMNDNNTRIHISDVSAVQNFPVSPVNIANNQTTSAQQTKQSPGIPRNLTSNKELNIIKGIVLDSNFVPQIDANVIVKNGSGNVEHSLKTDKNGAFIADLPLSNGRYTIEVIKGLLKFDIITIEASGALIPPITIIAKP